MMLLKDVPADDRRVPSKVVRTIMSKIMSRDSSGIRTFVYGLEYPLSSFPSVSFPPLYPLPSLPSTPYPPSPLPPTLPLQSVSFYPRIPGNMVVGLNPASGTVQFQSYRNTTEPELA